MIPNYPFRRAVAALLVPALLAAAPAQSQMIRLDPLPEDNGGAPETERSPFPVPPAETLPRYDRPQPDHSNGATAREVLLPLRAVHPQVGEAARYTLEGEVSEASFVLFLPGSDGIGNVLHLSTLSTINVLPERSSLEVMVNGMSVGSVTLDNFDAFRTSTLEIPAGLLRPGRNEVRLRALQTHRVFCGPDAAFGLWTTVALDRSGVLLGADEFGTDPLSFLSALAAQAARGEPISIHGDGSYLSLEQAVPVIAGVEDAFGGTPPRMRIEDYYATSPTLPPLARITSLPPGLKLEGRFDIRRGGDGAIVLVTEPDAFTEVGDALLGSLPGQLVRSERAEITPGEPVSLGALGLSNIQGSGRYIREAVRFDLPWDWLLLASQDASLRLLYRFDQNLPEGSLLLIKVNGTTVRLLPLDLPEEAGRPLPPLRVDFGAALLAPGPNRIVFEALVPGDPPDRACEPRANPVFEVSNRSTINVPKSPSMTRAGIARVLAHVKPAGISMSDAGRPLLPEGLLPQLAAVYARNDPDGSVPFDGTPRLVMGVPQDLPLMDGALVQLNAQALSDVLSARAPAVPAPEEPADAWEQVDNRGWLRSLLRTDRLKSLPERLNEGVEALWKGSDPTLAEWLATQHGEALLLQPDPALPGTVWLIVKARGEPERVVESLAAARGTFDGPRGQVSIYSPEAGWSSWTAPDRPLRLHEAFTLGNIRTVAGNVATSQPWAFVLTLMAFTLCSAFVAMIMAALARRRRK